MLTATQKTLVENHIEIAKKMALKKKRQVAKHIELEELISAAYLGLVDAASRYQGDRNFLVYAVIRIDGSMRDYLRGLGIGKKSTNSGGCYAIAQFAEDENGKDFDISSEKKSENFEELIEILNQEGREMFRWYYRDGLSARQIGDRIGVGEARVSQLMKKHRQILERSLVEC